MRLVETEGLEIREGFDFEMTVGDQTETDTGCQIYAGIIIKPGASGHKMCLEFEPFCEMEIPESSGKSAVHR